MSHDISGYRLKDGKCQPEFACFNRTCSDDIMEFYTALNATAFCGSPPFSGIGNGREFSTEEIKQALQHMKDYGEADDREIHFLEKCLEINEPVYILFS